MKRNAEMLTLKQRAWIFMEDNAAVNTLILLVIIFSTTCFVLETSFKEDELRVMWFGCAHCFLRVWPWRVHARSPQATSLY